MNRRPRFPRWAGSFLAGLLMLSPLAARPPEDPTITRKTIKRLQSLPYSYVGRRSFVLRDRHVKDVQYYGAGTLSQYGYVKKQGIMGRGLWLRLRNRGQEGWARSYIYFKKPLRVSQFNSLVLWVRANRPYQRLKVFLTDQAWDEGSQPQSQTGLIPRIGFPKNKVMQIVVPYTAFFGHSPLNYGEIRELGLEFGEDMTGNGKRATIEVLGLAFVEQANPPATTRIIPVYPKKNKLHKKRRLAKNQTKKKIREKSAIKVHVIPPVAQEKPAAASSEESPETASPLTYQPSRLAFAWLIFALFLFLSFFLFRKRKSAVAQTRHRKVLYEIQWPFDSSLSEDDSQATLLFWERMATKKGHLAWLSTRHTSLPKKPDEDYHGESFLLEQIRLAKDQGIELIPSLNFVRRVYHYDSFLTNPNLYMSKIIPQTQTHLSDEELRIKHIGYFPIWIPPYWQKKHGLPQRVLLAYGKLPGSIFTSDSIQYNLTSPDLRKMAVRVLKKMATQAKGVRLEGASALLNQSLHLYWNGQMSNGTGKKNTEFWEAVIQEVKAAYPNFLFIADSSGQEAVTLRAMGFDWVEEDRMREHILHQVRLEKAHPITKALRSLEDKALTRVIYRITPLLTQSSLKMPENNQAILAAALLSLLPGKVAYEEEVAPGFRDFIETTQTWSGLKHGDFSVIENDSTSVLSFMRWSGKDVLLVVANLSLQPKEVVLNLKPLSSGIEKPRLYLINDVFYGTHFLRPMNHPTAGPAMAISGQDLRKTGLALQLSGLSLKVISVNLTKPLKKEFLSEIESVETHS